jgi:tetratricopeptide (TPR) repeat protein
MRRREVALRIGGTLRSGETASRPARIAAFIGLLVGVTVASAAQEPPSSPEIPEAIQTEIQAAQEALTRAIAEFQGPQQSRSIVGFDDVIARLEGVAARYELPRRGRDMLVEAYEYRGRAYYGIGLQEKASENFRRIVLLKPDHALSREQISPKIVDLFDSVKKALVGYLAVSSQPPGARVTLVGTTGQRVDLGLTDFFPVEVLAGEYTVEVAREGYRTETRPLIVAARETETLEVPLTRVLASIFVMTQPDDVEIWIDGEHRLTTSGSLGPDHFSRARSGGLDPSRTSARIEIPNLALGSHTVEFRRECFATVRSTFDTPLAQDYDLEPVRLEDSVASLQLTSDPPGARIYINGDARGVTPAQIERICSGRVRVEVKDAAGKFITDLVLEKDQAYSIDCPIRPTLAFLGVEAVSAAGEERREEAQERILENLSKLKTVNLIPAPREAVSRVLEQEQTALAGLLPDSGSPPDLVRRVSDRLAAALEVQGFLMAVLPEERLHRTARLFILARGNTTAEAMNVAFQESASYIPVIERLDRQFTNRRTWSGLITVDTRLFEGVPVLRVVGGSPAAVAGLQPGELVEAVDGRPVTQTADILAAVAAKKPEDGLSLHVSGAGGARTADLVLEETVREIPLFDPDLLYNRAMVDLRGIVDGYPGTEEAAYAWLNLALCSMHFGDFAGAHDSLQKAKAQLPERPGLSRGTALYYLGVVLERLNYLPQAREAYREAASATEATLIDNDGPRVAPLAARRAES